LEPVARRHSATTLIKRHWQRIGGSSKNHRAFRVAGERRLRDFREENVLGLRHFQTAFRKLCQFSSRVDAPKDELYINVGVAIKKLLAAR